MLQKVYVACPDSQEILCYNLSKEGELTLIDTIKVKGQVQPMVFSKDKNFLYVGVRPDFSVLTYAIDPSSGLLSLKGSAQLHGSPTHIAIDNSGRFLFNASYSYNSVSISPIDAFGVVAAPIDLIEEINAPHSVNPIAQSNTFLIPALKEDNIRQFELEGNKLVESVAPISIQKGAGPRHMAFHQSGKYAYCINELDCTISTIALIKSPDTNTQVVQTLSCVPDDFNSTCWAADIHITPNNKFLYCCERTSSLISAFKLNEKGLIEKSIGFFETEKQPRGFAIDPTGQFIVCAGQLSDTISVFKIDSTSGKLINRQSYPTGKGAMWVLIK